MDGVSSKHAVNGSSIPTQGPYQDATPATQPITVNGNATTEPPATAELSNAEKKKLAKAEKAAKRAAEKGTTGNPAAGAVNGNGEATSTKDGKQKSLPQDQKAVGSVSKVVKEQKAKAQQPEPGKGAKQELGKPEKGLPYRPRSSHGASAESIPDNKQVRFFTHLYGQPRKQTLEGAPKEIHPAILTLDLQLSNYTICGSQARCVAMLLALKFVVQAYTTPMGTSLPRHLSSNYLSPQLSHIKSSRAFSTTQSNAIRWLKNFIANIDPSAPEIKAKNEICDAIDTFIRERFTVADQVIAEVAAGRIQDGDVVLTFGKSAVVQQTLVAAAKRGTQFRVVVIDSRPLFEGKNLARALASAGIEVTYSLTHGLTYVAKDITICMLGAHAILGNGRLYSRMGTALVAMTAKEQNVPVVVCAESIKFTERVALDSIVFNELAPEEELNIEAGELSNNITSTIDSDNKPQNLLGTWREKENLQLLNILFDTTPADLLDMVITEYGCLPPTSALAVQRMSAGS